MAARRKARKRAVDLLFEAEQRQVDTTALLEERMHDPERPATGYTVEVVAGVAEHRERIDEVLQTFSHGWALDRMPAVDRAVLRMAIWELLHNPEVPPEVAISEAVGLVTDLSTDDSPRFVNGLLARVAELRHTLQG
ncbi:MAG: transcription antitermination factor NusB [Kineosporiaceae bacterium]